ncbi:hypothetical protein HPB52_022005 [Rhipicephalus sanguineus]|uniref:THAP-type domain-containing protein n=1 Tax=Rhipicephalus sanguineus TaxID=34632 RepID=A0A9D4PSK4_RHISA|nr:hypothetical protein HPB52_022005 [Rhipicephalus sanguineus]
MPGCCAGGCSNKTEVGFSLYNIHRGIRNSARREVWLQDISREDIRATPSTRLCEEHFTPDQFEPLALECGIKKLKRDAVPTLLKRSRQRRRTKRPLPTVFLSLFLDVTSCVVYHLIVHYDTTTKKFYHFLSTAAYVLLLVGAASYLAWDFTD